MSDKKWLTTTEVAEALDVHPRTVLRLLADGDLPGNKIRGRWRIDRSVFSRWLRGTSNIQFGGDVPERQYPLPGIVGGSPDEHDQ